MGDSHLSGESSGSVHITPRRVDLWRAFLCAEAIYEDHQKVEEFIRAAQKELRPSQQLLKVHISCEKYSLEQNAPKFLVAYAEDATFIAFVGSTKFEENSSEYNIANYPARRGSSQYHLGIEERAKAWFTGDELKRILSELLKRPEKSEETADSDKNSEKSADTTAKSEDTEQKCKKSMKRIIFCGHRLGGSLAHMVLLRTMMKSTGESGRLQLRKAFKKSGKVVQGDLTMISIAFGAHPICVRNVAQDVNSDYNVQLCFFNCDHGEDNHVINVEYSRAKSSNSANSKDHTSESKFQPIGVNLMLKGKEKTEDGSSNWGKREFSDKYRSAVRNLVSELPCFDPADELDDLMPNTGELATSIVSTPYPKVFCATWKKIDTGKPFIEITGDNLLFLREPVKLNGIRLWRPLVQTDQSLLLEESSSSDANDEPEKDVNMITVVTAFGAVSCVMTEEFERKGEDTEVQRLLHQIMQLFMALVGPPVCTLPSPEELNKLDSIVQCVPGLKTVYLSTELKNLLSDTGADLVDSEKVRKTLISINSTIKQVTDFLTSSYKIDYKVRMKKAFFLGGALVATALAVTAVCWPIGVLIGVELAGAALGSLIGIFAISTPTVLVTVINKKSAMISDYVGVLQVAIMEATVWSKMDTGKSSKPSLADSVSPVISKLSKLWARRKFGSSELQAPSGLPKSCGLPSGPVLNSSQLSPEPPAPAESVADLENLLVEALERLGHGYLDQLLAESCKDLENLKLQSKLLKSNVTLDTKQRLLKRMKIVLDTKSLHKSAVEGKKIVGIVGAEDAGKSTFIRKALEQGGPMDDQGKLPEVGATVHTTVVKPYKLNDSLWLVDFPGSNGVDVYANEWKQFTSLPSSCILLLDFKDDIKKDQCDMYKTMKRDLKTQVTVVFNKVDEKFTKRNEATYTAAHFCLLRENAANQLGCKPEDVEFASLDPDIEEDKFNILKERGVLGFEELAKKLSIPINTKHEVTIPIEDIDCISGSVDVEM